MGPDGPGRSYDFGTGTWIGSSGNPYSLNAYAYANSNTVGANGDFAWEGAGAASRYAYLVLSAVPKLGFDAFDVTVENDAGTLGIAASGVGAPPVTDTNSLAPHGIFNTYFELYEFQFDGALTTISDTEPLKPSCIHCKMVLFVFIYWV